MDPDVLRAIARWPSVPAVFGWLRLDRRGNWRLVDRERPGFEDSRDAPADDSRRALPGDSRRALGDGLRDTPGVGPRVAPGDESSGALGSPIGNRRIVEFITRNYGCDERGRWFWQNGPQRVYVDVEAAPLVLRVVADGDADGAARLVAHTGAEVSCVDGAWIGPDEELLLRTDLGGAVVHDLDLAALPIETSGGSLVLRWAGRDLTIARTDSPEHTLGFVARPRSDAGVRGDAAS